MSDAGDTVSIDIYRPTDRVVGDRVHVIFDEDGRPRRLTLEPGGEWAVVAVELFEEHQTTRITLRREPTTT